MTQFAAAYMDHQTLTHKQLEMHNIYIYIYSAPDALMLKHRSTSVRSAD